jgi:hypothetical protein
MRTEIRAPGRAAKLAVCAVVSFLLAALPSDIWGQARGGSATRSDDAAIDVALGAIEGPVLQPFRFPPGAPRGIPPFPPYKQEPPAAQWDFRALTSPTGVPPPTSPGKGPGGSQGGGTGSGSGDGQPGPATGSGGASPPPSPPAPPPGQFPPPNIDPTPPNVLPPPGPGLPPLPPGPFLRPARAR